MGHLILPCTSTADGKTKAKNQRREHGVRSGGHDPCKQGVFRPKHQKGQAMPAVLCQSDKPLYLNTFPSWKGRQPFRFFLMENLLEARRDSQFPTNGAGPDEDVNVFLTGLLTRFLNGEHAPQVVQGARCLLLPPLLAWSRRQRMEYYLANGTHRLLHLGLVHRGDGLRRRPVPWGFTPGQSLERDMTAGATCLAMAVNLAEGRGIVAPGVLAVWRKLAENFEEYVHVLGVLATRRLGLGARLDDESLQLLGQGEDPCEEAPETMQAPGSMDHFLDRLQEYRANPDDRRAQNVWIAARRLGLPSEKVISALGRT